MRRFTPVWQTLAAAVAVLLAVGTQPAFASNDLLVAQQWGLAKIQSEASWGRSTGAGVVVAVIDTGVNFAHEDLAGSSAGSFSCMGGQCVQGGVDDNGHGTWVAGIIAARANNGKGIAGVAPMARIMSIKTLDKDGVGDIADVASAVRWATEHGAKVINLSLGSDLPVPIVFNLLHSLLGGDDPFQAAINYATSRGAAVIAAAGNGSLASGFAGLQNLLLVGATGPDDHIAGYSSSLLGVTLHAPGGEAVGGACDTAHCIVTTDKDGSYRAVQGTSFAAPHVSGVLAQLIALGFSPLGAEARLLTSADLGGGFRRLNAAAAVEGDPMASGATGAVGGLPLLGELSLPALTRLIGLGAASPPPAVGAPVAAPAPAPAAPKSTAGGTPRTDVAPAAASPALPGVQAQPPATSVATPLRGLPPAPRWQVVAGPGPALAAPIGPPPGHGASSPLLGVTALFVLLLVGVAGRYVALSRQTPLG